MKQKFYENIRNRKWFIDNLKSKNNEENKIKTTKWNKIRELAKVTNIDMKEHFKKGFKMIKYLKTDKIGKSYRSSKL